MKPYFNPKIVKHGYLENYSLFFQKIGYTFKNINFFYEAITHPSCRIFLSEKQNLTQNEKNLSFNYERLEFLGDKILGFVIGERLLKEFPHESEGPISKRCANMICGETCTQIAKNLDLGKYLIMSIGEENYNGRENFSNLENALEALIGAIFLDSNMQKTSRFILKHWKKYFLNQDNGINPDPKSFLQQWSQARFGTLPKYTVTQLSGPDHLPSFLICVEIDKIEKKFFGEGSSKKEAEKNAAQNMLKSLKLL